MPATAFSKQLVECRRAAGFKTPHEFYRKSGGAKVLRCSFVSYWRMEKGQTLPVGERIPILLSTLRLPVAGPATDELLRAYLRDLLGSDAAYRWFLERLVPAQPHDPVTLQDAAVRRVLADNYAPLSRQQFSAIVRDYGSYCAHLFLDNDQRGRKPAELARLVKVSPASMAKSLKGLAAAKVVKFDAAGNVLSAFAGKIVRLPAAEVTPAADRERVVAYRERLAREQGTRVFRNTVFLRAYEPELQPYYGHLLKALQAAHVFQVSGKPGEEKPGPTAMYMVQGQVTRLFPY